MGLLFAITICAAAFLVQTAISLPVGDQGAANSTEIRDQEPANLTFDVDLEDLCPCPKCWDPICGSDNETYANQCLFDCAKEKRYPELEVQFAGACEGDQFTVTLDDCHFSEEDTEIDNLPVEEADSKSTANSTEVRDQGTTNLTFDVDLEDLCPCPKCYDPVCGSDNQTYANQCLFDCAKEKRYPELEVKFAGSCEGDQFTITLDECHFSEEDAEIDSTTVKEEEKDSKPTDKEEDKE